MFWLVSHEIDAIQVLDNNSQFKKYWFLSTRNGVVDTTNKVLFKHRISLLLTFLHNKGHGSFSADL